ncbi:MAG: SPOR domain-containing protein [Methylophilaceae bacterium]|nr:SPOR domain-containing protein [Methylophilaceae bacterium]
MKQVLWLLLFINIALFAYFQASATKPKVTLIGNQTVQPEKIKLLSTREVALLPKKNPEAIAPTVESTTAAPTTCYAWENLPVSRVNPARTALIRLAPEANISEQSLQKLAFYWVYIPKQESLSAAKKKIEEIKALGVQESFVMQDAEYKNAISLGVFHEETAADKFLETLKTKRVTSAVKGMRYKDSNQVNLLIHNLKTEQIAEVEKLSSKFPGSELKPAACQ